MKKYFLLVIAVCTVFFTANDIASANTLDYRNGWFDNNQDKFTVNFPNVVDNNLNTYKSINSDTNVVIDLAEGISLDILSFYAHASNYSHEYNFYNSAGQKIKTYELLLSSTQKETINVALNLVDVKKIIITRGSINLTNIYEIEIFERKPRKTVSELSVSSTTHSSLNLRWVNPTDDDFSGTFIKQGGKVIATLDANATSYNIKDLDIDTDYKFEVAAVYQDGTISRGVEVSGKTKKAPTVKDLKATATSYRAKLTWINGVTDHVGVVIYKDNNKVIQLDKNFTYYDIKDLDEETTYSYQVALLFKNGVESQKANITFETKPVKKEVSNLTATANAYDVSLMWKMPEYKSLDFVRIYRQKPSGNLLARTFATEKYDPLFETNGTTFKDLTVNADTEYTYKVTTVDVDDNETVGEFVTIRTKKVVVAGGKTEEDENGDYVITWTSPTIGKIQVLIAGKEYATVPAADKKIVIPKDKMKFDLLGNPDVMLVPLDENGNPVGDGNKPGTPGSIGGIQLGDLGLDPKSLITVVAGLLALIGLIMLLAMSFRLTPKLIELLKNNFR